MHGSAAVSAVVADVRASTGGGSIGLMSADPHRVDAEYWWTISNTAMSEAEAIATARDIQERYPHVYAEAVDPTCWLTLHMDRWTVQTLRDGIELLAAQGREGLALLDTFDSWLSQARQQAERSSDE
jgi:hypothetical protein